MRIFELRKSCKVECCRNDTLFHPCMRGVWTAFVEFELGLMIDALTMRHGQSTWKVLRVITVETGRYGYEAHEFGLIILHRQLSVLEVLKHPRPGDWKRGDLLLNRNPQCYLT